MPLALNARSLAGRIAGLDKTPRPYPRTDYDFLLGRYVDDATLARASALAAQWGVHPHEVLIATGRLGADDYYRSLAEACGRPYRAQLPPSEVKLPASRMSPRQHLASGLLKDRRRAKHYVLAPDRLTPNALRHVLAQLYPYDVSLASPHAVRDAIFRHFATTFARDAVEGLATRFPESSARTKTPRWQSLSLALGVVAMAVVFLLAPFDTLIALTLSLAVLFVPVIGLRLVALYDLMREDAGHDSPPVPRALDRNLPVYTILVPLYREAHMVQGLVGALLRLDWPALGSKGTKAAGNGRAYARISGFSGSSSMLPLYGRRPSGL